MTFITVRRFMTVCVFCFTLFFYLTSSSYAMDPAPGSGSTPPAPGSDLLTTPIKFCDGEPYDERTHGCCESPSGAYSDRIYNLKTEFCCTASSFKNPITAFDGANGNIVGPDLDICEHDKNHACFGQRVCAKDGKRVFGEKSNGECETRVACATVIAHSCDSERLNNNCKDECVTNPGSCPNVGGPGIDGPNDPPANPICSPVVGQCISGVPSPVIKVPGGESWTCREGFIVVGCFKADPGISPEGVCGDGYVQTPETQQAMTTTVGFETVLSSKWQSTDFSRTTLDSQSDSYAIKSTNTDADSLGTLEFSGVGPIINVTYSFKGGSEDFYDIFAFTAGFDTREYSGNYLSGWQTETLTNLDTESISWSYEKDQVGTANGDTFYLDDVIIDHYYVEECDDGNLVNNDGCSNTCAVERCGDGILQPALYEQCDDGNSVNDDSCSNACLNVTPGAEGACGAAHMNITPGGPAASDLCDVGVASDIIPEFGRYYWTCSGNPPDVCQSSEAGTQGKCQDGFLDLDGIDNIFQGGQGDDEQCDDGNPFYLDGCNPDCKFDYYNYCPASFDVPATPATCGDGFIQVGEECDPNVRNSGVNCASDCTLI